MPRTIDMIRVSALPSNLMHAASRGSLNVPADEMIEILVHLATKNQIFGMQARMTLASWDEAACRVAAASRCLWGPRPGHYWWPPMRTSRVC